jgi:hypothetical protein
MNPAGILSEYAHQFEKYLGQTRALSILHLDRDLVIRDVNHHFAGLLDENAPLEGRQLREMVLPESRELLESLDSRDAVVFTINFRHGKGMSIPVHCHVFKTAEGWLILGEPFLLSYDESLQKMSTLTNELANMTRELQRKNRALEKARDEIKTLSGIVPICMYCKTIRDDQGYWNQLEHFITEHSEAQFSHSICPKCFKEHFPDEAEEDEET